MAEHLASLAGTVARAVVFGGPAAVTPDVLAEIDAALQSQPSQG